MEWKKIADMKYRKIVFRSVPSPISPPLNKSLKIYFKIIFKSIPMQPKNRCIF